MHFFSVFQDLSPCTAWGLVPPAKSREYEQLCCAPARPDRGVAIATSTEGLRTKAQRCRITAIKARISDRVIRAPFDGVVGLRDISVGALVESGDLIAALDDTSQIKLDFSVPAVFLAELKPGLKIKAHATALGNKEYRGEVKSIDSRVDPVTRSVQVRAILPNPDGSILPGILMQVDLLRNTRQAIVIPEAALLPLANRQ